MRHFRELKIKKDNTKDFVKFLNELSKSKNEGWSIDNELKLDFIKENDIPSEYILVFRSPYFTYIKTENEKRVFRGILYLGILNNTLQIFEIKDEIDNQPLTIHMYNYVLHQFIENVIEVNKQLMKDFFGVISRKKNKPILQSKELENKNPKKSLVITTNPNEYKIFNTRLRKPIHFFSPDKNGEMLLQESDEIKIDKNLTIEYFTPNNISLLLSISNSSRQDALSILKLLKEDKKYDNPLDKIKSTSELACNYIEKIQTAVVFSYTSLEVFANLSIPDNYEYIKIKKEAGVLYEQKFTRDAIERLFPLKEKLKDILPDIYETQSIEEEPFWGRFCNLEMTRDKIIHQKSAVHTEYFKEYFGDSFFKLCSVSEEIINFFYDNCKHHFSTNPLWPWMEGKENIFPRKHYNPKYFQYAGSIHKE